MVSEVEEFLAGMLPLQLAAEHALCRGDAGPRSGTWSQRDPVTLFGAAVPVRRGWDEVSSTFRWLAHRFSDLHGYRREDRGWRIVHRHGDHVRHDSGAPEHPPAP